MENIFITACILHNMLLDHDVQFETAPFRVGGEHSVSKRRVLVNNVSRLLRKNDDWSHMDQGGVDPETTTEVDSDFGSMRIRLANHTYYMFRHRLLSY